MRRALLALTLLFVLVPALAGASTCFIKQSTAVDIGLGPFVDATDGVTAETALTISQADVRLKKTSGAWAQKGDTNSCTHEENGWYECAFNTTDTGTAGQLIIAVNESGALPVWKECVVLPGATYDALVTNAAGAANGFFIAGTNAQTTITSASGSALILSSTGGNGHGLVVTGNGTGNGINISGGATAAAARFSGGGTSGEGISITTTSGDGISIAPTAGHGLVATANGTNKHGMQITGGTAGVSDGIKAVAGTGGKDIRGSLTNVEACSGCSTSGGTTLMPVAGYLKGSTSVIVDVWIKDTTTNLGKTGLTNASSGLTLSYCRVDQGNAACSAITPAAATRGNYTSGGFVEKDATLAPGMYEVGLPTAVLATGADWVDVWYAGVSGTAPTKLRIELVDKSSQDVFNRLGAPAGASIAADIAAVKTDTVAIKTKTDSLVYTGGAVNAHIKTTDSPLTFDLSGTVSTVTALSASAINAIADQVWDELIAQHLTSSTTGAALNAAGSSGDPWATPLPGAYGAGTAGNILGTGMSNLQTRIPATIAELTQATPPVNPTLAEAIMALYMAMRNQTQTTAAQIRYMNDAGTVIFKCNLADDGTTFTKSECVAGP
jgi:hypothetical protein